MVYRKGDLITQHVLTVIQNTPHFIRFAFFFCLKIKNTILFVGIANTHKTLVIFSNIYQRDRREDAKNVWRVGKEEEEEKCNII